MRIMNLSIGALALLAANAVFAESLANCRREPLGTGRVQAVVDGRTLTLDDGREVRLSGIELSDAEPHSGAARAALAAMLAGRTVALTRPGLDSDRYGRIAAQVFDDAVEAGTASSAQRTLLVQGLAMVAARVGDASCAAELLVGERAARAESLGLWANPRHAIRKADAPATVLAERGRFTLVEGLVLSVRESGGTLYVNFGRRWSEDFTVTVQKRSERVFMAAGLELRALAGRPVRVRGVIEERGGPWVEAMRPEQIEIIER
jgi:endonuclease YncB( thermonuclease family)